MQRKDVTIFALMGILYVFIEVAYSSIVSMDPALIGGSSLWMMLVGGLLGVTLGKLNQMSWFNRLHHAITVLIGVVAITGIELVSGIILNRWLGFDIWDYSDSSLNLLGQIDWVHSLCWVAITPLAFWADDVLRHYLFDAPKPPALISYYYRNVREPITLSLK